PTRTTCPYCGVGCGLLVSGPRRGAVITGDPQHPANFGRLCSKGSALAQTLGLEDRLLFPTIGGRNVAWDEAIGTIATRFAATIAEHGPDSVAFYVSGQLLTEDYYVANKLMKGFLGSANIDTNSRLCMASSVAAYKRAFGADIVPCSYEDLELASLVVLVGSNLAWCHPVLFQRLAAAREKHGTRIVVIDPRRTATCEIADLHLAITPGSDVALFAGLLDYLQAEGWCDQAFVAGHTIGAEEALAAARELGQRGARLATGLTQAQLQRFYALFAGTPRVVTAWSQGVNQSSAGTDKASAIINCHLLTGRIGKPGAGPFSVTGQPNAMGGREVGGLANMLAAHMDIENADHRSLVQEFWRSPTIATHAGFKAIDMFAGVADGRIKAIWIAATNPAASMPDAGAVEAALRACPFVVVSDISARTDTARHAHVLLPAAAWGEKEGTVTNSERRVSRQRPFLAAPADAKPDWWMFAAVARRMGFEGFDYTSPDQILREHASLTATANDGARGLNLGGIADLDELAYGDLEPFQWPRAAGTATSERMFADGKFFTADHRARLVPTRFRAAVSMPTQRYGLILNTGRVRDQWHTMSWSGKSDRLMAHTAEPFVEIHPDDAAARGVAPATLAQIDTPRGTLVARAVVTDRQRRGGIFLPMHWTDQHSSAGRMGQLIAPNTDPVSGQPELKYTAADLQPWPAKWYAYAVSVRRPRSTTHSAWQRCEYRALAPVDGGWQLEMAGTAALSDAHALLRWLSGSDAGEILELSDTRRGLLRLAIFEGDHLAAALFVAGEPVAVDRSFLIAQLGTSLAAATRISVLAGMRGGSAGTAGALICACHGVSASVIRAAICERGAATVAAVGECTMAGTGCGSCRMEIGRMLREMKVCDADVPGLDQSAGEEKRSTGT
ncbi:MAG TPA: molybdopterin-dependent oxidoreductase, partial [Candidatus Binatia bacterium]|nr:molybdopterin-dependent oxidoreductase [Candidatus Binatia bacterium]